jgi:hypothetical protein
MNDDRVFLTSTDFDPIAQDEHRVLRCLVDQRNDIRHLTINLLCKKDGKHYVNIIISALANAPTWKDQICGAAKKLLPYIDENCGDVLAECFESLAIRDETAYQVLCLGCNNQNLNNFLMNYVRTGTSPRKTHLAMKALNCTPATKVSFWQECLKHRHEMVRHCAREYLKSGPSEASKRDLMESITSRIKRK